MFQNLIASLLLIAGLLPAFCSAEPLPSRPRVAGTSDRLPGERAAWLRNDSIRTFILLVGGCGMCLLGLEWRVRRRSSGSQQRQATALAGALRGGALEFESMPGSGVPVWKYAEDDGQEEHRCLLPAKINRSRYELLNYRETSGGLQEPVVTISYLGGGSDPDSLIRDEDLLLGIPREFLEDAPAVPSADVEQPGLSEGSAAGDDPGESVLHGDSI